MTKIKIEQDQKPTLVASPCDSAAAAQLVFVFGWVTDLPAASSLARRLVLDPLYAKVQRSSSRVPAENHLQRSTANFHRVFRPGIPVRHP